MKTKSDLIKFSITLFLALGFVFILGFVSCIPCVSAQEVNECDKIREECNKISKECYELEAKNREAFDKCEEIREAHPLCDAEYEKIMPIREGPQIETGQISCDPAPIQEYKKCHDERLAKYGTTDCWKRYNECFARYQACLDEKKDLGQESVLSENDLVKTPDSPAIWLIQAGKRRVVPHIAVYNSWGYPADFSTVKTVSDLSDYPEGDPIPLRDSSFFRGTTTSLYGKSASAVFYVENGKLRPIKSSEIYQSLFNDPGWGRITWVPNDLLSKFEYSLGDMIESSDIHPDGSLVRYAGQSGIYLIREGKKRPIVSKKAFEDNHFKWGNVIDIDLAETYPDGPIIDKLEDTLIVPQVTVIIIAPVGTLPGSPALTDPGVSVSAGNSFTLDWLSVPNAIIYILERDTNPSFTNPTEIYGGALSHYYEALSPAADTTYYYRVQSKNNVGSSAWSNVVDMEVKAAITPVPASIKITSPNRGEIWRQGGTYTIQWKSTGLTKVNIHLFSSSQKEVSYGQEQGSTGKVTRIASEVDATKGSYTWRIPTEISLPEYPCHKINIAGDGYSPSLAGKVYSDESDYCFSIVEGITPPSPAETDLEIKSVTKGDFHSYGFQMQVCVHGSKSINDLKKEISGLTDFPCAYEVIDTDGQSYYRYVGAAGSIEQRKNGECETIGWTIQLAEQPIFDRSGKVKMILDPNHLIKETKEDNNGFLYSSITCLRDENKKGVTCGGYFYEDYCEFAPDGTAYANIRKCNASCGTTCGSLVNVDRISCSSGCQNGACIAPPGEKSITVLSPNGGESWPLGSTQTIRWTSSNVTRVSLDLVNSTGNLVVKNLVNMTGNSGSANWTIPTYIQPGQYWMRVGTCPDSVASCTTVNDDPVTIYDTSDAPFSIVAAGTPFITVLSPNGGEKFQQGAAYQIKWQSTGITSGNVKITICMTVASYSAVSRSETRCSLPLTVPNSGLYQSTFGQAASIGDYTVRVEDATNPAVFDESDAPFSIVAAISYVSEQVKCVFKGSQIEQKCYTATDSSSIYYNLGCSGKETCVVDLKGIQGDKITWKSSCGGYAYTTMDGVNEYAEFNCVVPTPTITPSPSITVLSPNGGEVWTIGQTKRVSWGAANVNYVRIYIEDLTIYGSGSTNYIYDGAISASTGYYDWTIQKNQLPGATLTFPRNYKIRIDGVNDANLGTNVIVWDRSDNFFTIQEITTPSITVISPNGGEKWVMENTYEISWEAKGVTGNFEIYLRDDRAGPSYKLIATEIPNSSRKYSWKIPSDFWGAYFAGSTYKIQVREISGAAGGGPGEGIFDESNNYFSIVAASATPSFSIADVANIKDSYPAGVKISIAIKGLESDGTPASKTEGFNVQAYIFDSPRTKTFAGVNGLYNSGTSLWDVELTAPSDQSLTYDIEVFLYCGSEGSVCATKYGLHAQITKTFRFTILPPPTLEENLTDLEVKNVTKGDFSTYGFFAEVCVHGPKSINDLKKEISGLTSFPFTYEVIDVNGTRHRGPEGAAGGIEDWKDGKCGLLGWVIQSTEQSMYDQSGQVEVILDSNNLIKESNENNNKLLYKKP